MKLELHFAPLQGYTEDAYRRLHHDIFGGVNTYYTPFLRLEHGTVRPKDLRDISAEHNQGLTVVPQVIANGGTELEALLPFVQAQGYQRVDINMGCPFPLQTRHGRGAGLLLRPEKVGEIADVMLAHPEISFSLKMRLGMESCDEWRDVLPIVNRMPLAHLCVHPRVARQQYKGEVNMEAFESLVNATRHPVIYNGDIVSVEMMTRLQARFAGRLHGFMLGRGLLAQPWLAQEYVSGERLSCEAKRSLLLKLHTQLLAHFELRIPDEAQRLNKIRTLWEYMEPTLGRKQWKRLMKAGNMRNYLALVEDLFVI